MKSQEIINGYEGIEQILQKEQIKNCLIVHGNSFKKQKAFEYINDIAKKYAIQLNSFCDYTSNPKIEEVQAAVTFFEEKQCDFIIAAGGGSAIDVAKCIKQRINKTGQFADQQDKTQTFVKMLAIPTTAGTGSESTQFAVIYENGEKTSIDDEFILPEYVILDGTLLKGLPAYHRKATMMDALCQAIESIWAKKATSESQEIAAEAIRLIMANYEGYLKDDPSSNEGMIRAANLAGQAINYTRTTAAHAMSYKITTLYDAAHGHAVAICLSEIWLLMLDKLSGMSKNKVAVYEDLLRAFNVISESMGCNDVIEALLAYQAILKKMRFPKVSLKGPGQLKTLVSSVNEQRLGNHPMPLNKEDLKYIYEQVLK